MVFLTHFSGPHPPPFWKCCIHPWFLVGVWGLISWEMWIPMVFVFCCDSGFYRFTLVVMLVLDWASGGGLRLVHLTFASSSWLTLWAFGLCLAHWLTPRSFGLCLKLLAYASSFWLVPRSLACASFIWPSPRALGLRFELLACASSIGLHLACASCCWFSPRALEPCPVTLAAPLSPGSGAVFFNRVWYGALVSVKEAEGVDRGGQVDRRVLGPY